MGFRQKRVNSLIIETVSEIIAKEVKDPRVGLITLISAEISPDFKHVTIYFTVHGGSEEGQKNSRLLNHASGFFQHELAKRLKFKYTPKIQFKYNQTFEKIKHIEILLNKESEEESEKSD